MKLYSWDGYNESKYLKDYNRKVIAKQFLSDYEIAEKISKNKIQSDILNINNAYVRDYLDQKKLLKELNKDQFESTYKDYIKYYENLSKWTISKDKKRIIGIAQRFGNFGIVINNHKISRNYAEQYGYNIIKENKLPYGLLLLEDFNIMQISLSTGINPFRKLTKDQINIFNNKCIEWMESSSIISNDYKHLNKLLSAKTINCYLTGGTYTCSISRREGIKNIISIIPRNKIRNLRQGILFTEITSLIKNNNKINFEDFLKFMLREDKCYQIAMSKNTCNPVIQMGNKKIFSNFSKEDLSIIQWNNLKNDSEYCHEYQIVPDYKNLIKIFRKNLNKYKYKTHLA